MMIICYSGRSAPTAERIADQSDDIFTSRSSRGTVNWGRATANTKLNPDISNTTNKRVMRQLFKEHDVPMPYLLTKTDLADFQDGRSNITSIVGRPDNHTRGRGFWKANWGSEAQSKIDRARRGTHRKKAATHWMEYIDAPHELRVHIFLGKSIRISEKKFDADHHYTTIKPTCPVDKARKAAKQAVEALGLDFGAVDILVMEDGTPYVLEVNAAPGLGGSLPALYAETFLKWEGDNM